MPIMRFFMVRKRRKGREMKSGTLERKPSSSRRQPATVIETATDAMHAATPRTGLTAPARDEERFRLRGQTSGSRCNGNEVEGLGRQSRVLTYLRKTVTACVTLIAF